MLIQLKVLAQLDVYKLRLWFSQHKFSKLTVVVGFLLVFSGLFSVFFLLSSTFFYSMKGFDHYGLLTAEYIFNASLVVLFWLGLGSSLIATLSWLMRSNPENEHLLSLPTKPQALVTWNQVKAFAATFTFLGVFISPIHLGFFYIFDLKHVLISPLNLALVLFTLTAATQTLAGITAFTTARYLKNQGPIFLFSLLIFVFLAVAVGLIQVLFPASLRRLYFSQPDEFTQIYVQLPLNSFYSPTKYLSSTLTSGINLPTISLLAVSLLAYTGFLLLAPKKLLRTFQQLQVHHRDYQHPLISSRPIQYPIPLISNLWLKTTRVTSEIGMTIFLLLLASFFFLLLSQAQIVRNFEVRWTNELFVFVLAWILFFACAYTLRTLFPLATQLHKQGWLLLSLPLQRSRFLLSYLGHGLIISLPLIIISVFTWVILPLPAEIQVLGMSFGLYSVLVIGLINLLAGTISIGMTKETNPDLVSTSPMGMLSLSYVVVYGVTLIGGLYLMLHQLIGLIGLISVIGLITVIPLLFLSVGSRISLDRFEYH